MSHTIEEQLPSIIGNTLIGNLVALNTLSFADISHPLVARYLELMQQSASRHFHTLEYVFKCVKMARDISGELDRNPHVIAALLFHKIGYVPRDPQSLRRSFAIALEFYPGEMSVQLIRYMRAAQIEESILQRYGDDRDYIADIVLADYGQTWEEFRKGWGERMREYMHSKCSPEEFKRLTAVRLKKLLTLSKTCGIFHTRLFNDRYQEVSLGNIRRLMEEIQVS